MPLLVLFSTPHKCVCVADGVTFLSFTDVPLFFVLSDPTVVLTGSDFVFYSILLKGLFLITVIRLHAQYVELQFRLIFFNNLSLVWYNILQWPVVID